MSNHTSIKPTPVERYFGKCRIAGCKTRRVLSSPYINDGPDSSGEFISYSGRNREELRAAGIWCTEHNTFLKFSQLQARTIPDRDCDGRCMSAIGPSCDCSCGGENHGKNHVS